MTRAATDWHSTVDSLGRTIHFTTSDEPTVKGVGVCSIRDPHSDMPSCRLADGRFAPLDPDCDAPVPERGLVCLGTSKFDRPTIDELAAMSGIKGHIAAAAVESALGRR